MVRKNIVIASAVIAVLAILIVVMFVIYFTGYNTALAKDENVKRLAADTDTQLQSVTARFLKFLR